MPANSIYAEFLAAQGYALFESRAGGSFAVIGSLPEWCAALWSAGTRRAKSIRLGERSPFLENFLVDAAEFWRAKTSGTLHSGNWIERGSDGKQVPLEAAALRLGRKQILVVRTLEENFAERQQWFQTARDFLLAQERLTRETQKKEILLHCIIHDLSQPLTAMRGCFDMLLVENPPPQMAKFVGIGQREAQRQEQMIRGVLEAFSADLSIAQNSGAAARGPDAPDLAERAQHGVQEFSAAFGARRVRLELDAKFDHSRSWRVAGDSARIDRIFGNLLENALRHSPPGSKVVIGLEDQGAAVLAFVDDEGPGLPKDIAAARLFSLFSRGKENPGKAGLGLYFCRVTVERWGGTIGAETRAVGGSRFWFRLLRAREEPQKATGKPADSRPAPVADSPAPRSSLRVLIADDNETILELASELLAARGHVVETAANGREALEKCKRLAFDVVLLDQEMPQMRGLDAARALRESEKGSERRTRIVGLSGNATTDDERRSLEAGMDAFLGKPFDRQRLYAAVEAGVAAPTDGDSADNAPPPPRQIDGAQGRRTHLRNMTGGNEKLLRSLIATFLKDAPKKYSAIRRAVARKQPQELAAAAHSLKGSVAIFGPSLALETARKLEATGRAGHARGTAKELPALEKALADLTLELRDLAPKSEGDSAIRSARPQKRGAKKR
jgi:signal transduction histidine kinase/CheY-like chemotaxis protein